MLYEAVVSWNHDSALPSDVVVNTLWFDIGDHDTDAMAALSGAIETGYTEPGLGGFSVVTYLSDALSGFVNVRWYRHADASPRTPEFSYTFIATIGSAQALPSEVAVCLSFSALPISGTDQRNRRGRIYVGPLNVNAITDVGQIPRVASNLQTALLDMAQLIYNAAISLDPTGSWRVYSRTNNASAPVETAWVDNAFDIQRRRGERATQRATNLLLS